MRKCWGAWILMAGLVMSLSGCQLAKQDLGEETGAAGDRLIGMFITQEYLDLFDFEGYFNDHMGQMVSGKETVIGEAESRAYEKRVYAVYQSADETFGDYVFEGLEGICFFHAKRPFLDDSTYVLQAGPEVTDIRMSETDAGTEIEGTIYCATGKRNRFYCNPVYQTAKGDVYLIAGTGISGDLANGVSFSQRMDENRTTYKNGEASSESYAVSITICGQDAYDRHVIAQMDELDQKLGESVYSAEDVPDSITVLDHAAYLLCTSYQAGDDGTEKVSRQVVELSGEENDFSLFVPAEGGITVRKQISANR